MSHQDTIADAQAKLKKLAASTMVQKEQREAELAQLKAKVEQLEADRALAIEAGEDALALEVSSLLTDLQEQVSQKDGELALAEQTYQEVLTDLKQLRKDAPKLSADLAHAEAMAPVRSDPFDMSLENRALDNARRGIQELDAQVTLDRELNAEAEQDRETQRKLRALEKEQADAKARAQLAELKAKFKKKKEAAGASAEAPADEPSDGPSEDQDAPKKRTL